MHTFFGDGCRELMIDVTRRHFLITSSLTRGISFCEPPEIENERNSSMCGGP